MKIYYTKFYPIKTGIQIARHIVYNNIEAAVELYEHSGRSWSVAETRAIIGAVNHVNDKYNANLDWHQFMT